MSELTHYGTPRHSGRYPWGSGEDPAQRNKTLLFLSVTIVFFTVCLFFFHE